ncbi:hypothetical protein N658DRAFT_501479 [Parathielavia hyrcaniae]|uniref:Uncharacterized protein n=1 Tax=Parathielavia hyrcaniae TaxID=113614 RepID=A0AAN6PRB9_9PEZI|nr:hypothetical protein N658DRAFT_501479 [Parathielavia hyrcaniae]
MITTLIQVFVQAYLLITVIDFAIYRTRTQSIDGWVIQASLEHGSSTARDQLYLHLF